MKTERSALATAREILGEMSESGPRLATFARGLALGALVGAAIAGTALIERRARQPKEGDARTEDPPPK